MTGEQPVVRRRSPRKRRPELFRRQVGPAVPEPRYEQVTPIYPAALPAGADTNLGRTTLPYGMRPVRPDRGSTLRWSPGRS